MNQTIPYAVFTGLILTSCGRNKQAPLQENNSEITDTEVLSPCQIRLGDILFTKAQNDGDKAISITGDTLKFVAGPQTDYFCSPNGSVINNSPVIFTEID